MLRSMKWLSAASIAVVAGTALLAAPSDAHAAGQSAEPVSGTGKGIAGGALLGGEIGFISLSAAGAHNGWLYATIPSALAIGGGIGGYFIEKGKTGTDAQVPMFMLAGGMALIIPTVVITLSANPSYVPGAEDGTPLDSTPAEAVGPGATTTTTGSPSVPTPATTTGTGAGTTTVSPPAGGPVKHKPDNTSLRGAPARIVPALFNLDVFSPATTLSLGVPLVALRPIYTAQEVTQFGQVQKYSVDAPIVAVAF